MAAATAAAAAATTAIKPIAKPPKPNLERQRRSKVPRACFNWVKEQVCDRPGCHWVHDFPAGSSSVTAVYD
jgi:hypothetical protein